MAYIHRKRCEENYVALPSPRADRPRRAAALATSLGAVSFVCDTIEGRDGENLDG